MSSEPDKLLPVPSHWRLDTSATPPRYAAELWLLGQPPLGGFLDFLRDCTAEGDRSGYRLWRSASDRYFDLREAEAGEAEAISVLPLDPPLCALADEAAASPAFRAIFAHLPHRFAMVELDRMVAFQRLVRLPQIMALREQLAAEPVPAAVFRICHPTARPAPQVDLVRHGSRRYVFTSDATDLRFLGTRPLDPLRLRHCEQDGVCPSSGPVGAALALSVGFGANFLNLLESDGRLVLQNGYHRAVALRSLGYTHAPCVVQTLSQREELNLVGASPLIEDPVRWFRSPRPPLLRDFFDPELSRAFLARRPRRAIEVSIEVREYDLTS